MKIINLVTHLEPAGAQAVAVWLTSELRKREHSAEALFIFRKRSAFEGVDGIRVLYSQRPPAWRAPEILFRLVTEFRAARPDAVITHSHFASVLGGLAAWIAGVPTRMATLHNPVGTLPRIARWLGAVLGMLGGYTHVVAVSEAVARSAAHYPRAYRKRLRVIYNGIRMPRPVASRAEVRTALGVVESRPMLLHVGRLNHQKNHEFLLEIIRQLPEAVLVLVGDGERREELALRVHALGIEDRVRFLGEMQSERVASLMAASDVFLFPSHFEAFGLAMVEAMAIGCPVIASEIPSTIEVLDACGDAPAGVVLPARDPSLHVTEWVAAIRRLLSEPELRQELVRRGRARAERYSLGAMVDGYEAATLESFSPSNERSGRSQDPGRAHAVASSNE